MRPIPLILALASVLAAAPTALADEPAARATPRRGLSPGPSLPSGEVVVKRGNLVRRALGWRHRPEVVVTRENAADLLASRLGKPVVISTVFDQAKAVPARIGVTKTYTTFRSAYAPDGPDLLYPPAIGEYLIMRHENPVVFKRLISREGRDGKEVRFDGADGRSYLAYKRSDSVKLKGTLEQVRGGQLVVRTRNGQAVSLSIDDAMKVLLKQ